MGWLSRLSGAADEAAIEGVGIRLRLPQLSDYAQWRELRQDSRAFLTPWEPQWSEDELSSMSFRLRLRAQRRALEEGTAKAFFIFSVDNRLLGGINITNIRRGVAQCGTLGYWIGHRHASKGHMSQAMQSLLAHARSDLSLHRIEASCLPSNAPSIKLLSRAGFEREGFAKDYLKINGNWADHILWGKRLSTE
jgi:[ribosomal protein S5]-alanine N-acetyltransferase